MSYLRTIGNALQVLLTAVAVVAVFMPTATAQQTVTAQPAGNIKKDLFLKDDAKCTECHDEGDSPKVLHIGKTKHGTVADGRTPTCTSCHGDRSESIGSNSRGDIQR